MESITPNKKLEPGVFTGTPEAPGLENVAPRIIRTMKSDMAEAVIKQNETKVSIAIAEEKKKAKEHAESETIKTDGEDTSPAPKPHGRIIVVIVVILIITAFGLAYVFVLPRLSNVKLSGISIPSFPSFGSGTTNETAIATEPVLSLAPSILPPQYEKIFNLSNYTPEKVTLDIADEMKQGIYAGSIKNFLFEESIGVETKTISTNRFFEFFNFYAPDILTRSLEEGFMVGILGREDWGATPFIVLKVSGYDASFAGMLDWEKYLPSAFDTLFGTNIDFELKSKIKFNDIVVLNRDARTIETPSGKSISYVFANDDTIIIAGDVSSLEALIGIADRK